MSREVFEGNYKVYFVPTIASPAAPTVAQITGGTYLGTMLTKDGVALNVSQSSVDTAGIDSLWDTQIGGSAGMTPELTMFRDGTDESDGYDLIVQGTNGFLVICPFGVPVAAKKVIVIPIEMGIAKPTNSAANEAQKFTVSFFMTGAPQMQAVVAA